MSVALVVLAACSPVLPRPSPHPSPSPQPARRRAASTSSRRSVSSTYSPRLSSSRAAPAVITSDQSPSASIAESYFDSPAPSPPHSRLISPDITNLHANDPTALPQEPSEPQSHHSAGPTSTLSATAPAFVPPMRRNVSSSQRSIRTSSRRGSDASKSSISDGFRPGPSAPTVTATSRDTSIGLGSAPASRVSASGSTSRASSISETLVDAQGALGGIVSAEGAKAAGPTKLKKKNSFSLPFTRRTASAAKETRPEDSRVSNSGPSLGERLKRSLSGRK